MSNDENPPEKGGAAKGTTMAGVALAMIGLCSVIAKGVFDHFDDIKLLLGPKTSIVASPTPTPQTAPTPPIKLAESPTPTKAAERTLVREEPTPYRSPAAGQEGGGLQADENHAPVAIVRGYYDALNRRSLPGAYDRLSVGFRGRRSLADFSKVFADTVAIAPKQVREVSRNNETATVFVEFRETDSDHREREWQGNVYLVREQAGWRIERTDLKRL